MSILSHLCATCLSTLHGWARRIAGLDVRSLAVLRMGLGVALIAETLWHIPNITPFFTDLGLYPSHLYAQLAPPLNSFSLYLASGAHWWAFLLFGFQLTLGLALILGYKTRLATFLGWVMILSMQSRTLHTLYGGDVLLRVLFFWSLFLPLGRAWSLDSQATTGRFWSIQGPLTVYSVATWAYVLQVVIFMADTAIHKLGSTWSTTFTALQESLQSSIYRLPPFGDLLLTAPDWFLQGLTLLTFGLELLAPLLILLPFRRGLGRYFGILGYWLIFFGIALTLSVDLFPLFGFICVLGLLPGWLWPTSSTHADAPLARSPLYQKISTVARFFILVPLASVILYNTTDQGWTNAPPLVHQAVHSLRLDQRWVMFAPPPTIESWLTASGTLRNGMTIDVWQAYRGQSPFQYSHVRPEDNYRMFPTEKWHKYLISLVHDPIAASTQRERFAWYLCRWWNTHQADPSPAFRLDKLSLLYHRASLIPPYPSEPTRPLIEDYYCRG